MTRQQTAGRERRPEAGFTLVEALTAIVILVFGLVAVTNLLFVAASSNTVANHGTAATSVASGVLERLKAVPFLNLPLGGSLSTDQPATNNPPPQCLDDTFNYTTQFNCIQNVERVTQIKVRWQIVDPGIAGSATRFIAVRAEPMGGIAGRRARVEFTTFRACTVTGCP